MTTLQYRIDDMTCGHCVKTITQAVQKTAPQATVTADLAAHRVEIANAGDAAAVEAAIKAAGYAPQSV